MISRDSDVSLKEVKERIIDYSEEVIDMINKHNKRIHTVNAQQTCIFSTTKDTVKGLVETVGVAKQLTASKGSGEVENASGAG